MAVWPIGDGDVEAAELGLDPESRGWMDGLRSPAAERNAVLARLHGLLLHVARCETGRRNGWLCLSGPDRDDLARQAAADALRAITVQLDGFCGQSRFWNWACKFVVFGVSAAAGRRFWQARTASLDGGTGTGSPPASSHRSAENGTSFTVRGVPRDEAGPVLKQYVRIARATRPYFQATKDSPVADFAAGADRHPVFELTPAGEDRHGRHRKR